MRIDNSTMKKHIVLTVLLGFYATLLTAQSINGSILDKTHQGIPYATVRLLKVDSTFVEGTHADSVGVYSLEPKQKGTYLLHVSSIGYQPHIFPIRVQGNEQLPPVVLQTADVALGEVTVSASSYVRQDDKIIIFPDKKQVKHSFTGYDLLYRLMIPGVEVDRMEEKVSTLNGDVTLYLDGRKVDAREIRGLNANEIEKVEYYDVPSGKYMNDYAAINFITKKYATGGYVALNGEQRIGYMSGKYGGVAKLARNHTSYTLFAGYSMNNHDGTMNDTQEHFLFSDHETDRHSATLENRVKNNSQYAQLNVANQNDKHSLIGKISFVRNDAPDNYNRSLLEYGKGEKRQESFNYTDQRGWKSGVELYGYFKLNDKQFLETTIGGEYSDNTYAYTYRENSFSTLNNSDEGLYELSLRCNYGIQFNHKNSLNVQAFHFQTISSVDYKGENPSWQHFWIGESLLFLEYNQRLSDKFSFRLGPGISYIQYRLHGDSRKEAYSPRLHSGLTYSPSKNQQIQLNCPVGNGQLTINQLNEVEQQIDSLQIRRGAPNQNIAFQTTPTLSYSGQLGKFNVGATVLYNIINDATSEHLYIENDKLIRSCDSDSRHRALLSRLSASWKVTDNLRLKMAGAWVRMKYNTEKVVAFSGNMQVDYYWKDFSCGVFVKSKDKGLTINLMRVTIPAKYGAYVSWSHKGWRMEGGVKEPFSKHNKCESILDKGIYRYQNIETGQLYRPSGYVKLAYTFDFGKKTTREREDVNTTINSSILKADK